MVEVDQELPLEEQLQLARTFRQEFLSLLKSPGWGHLVEYMQEMITEKERSCLTPTVTMDGLVSRQADLGMRQALLWIQKLPKGVVDSLDETIEMLKEQLNVGEDDG